MRITKENAEAIARKLTENKKKEYMQSEKELSDFAYEQVKKAVPKNVFDFYQKNKNWFNENESANFVGQGLNHEYVYFNGKLPQKATYGRDTISLEKEEAKTMVSLLQKRDTLRKKLKELVEEIANALLTLKTYAKITAEFKEAAQFLPKSNTTSLTVNIQDILKKL